VKYGYFSNIIYLGAYSDISPQSFTGYLKEIRFFTTYHGIYQMNDEAARLYRLYSYDDSKLVAYWKLSEPYTSTDLEYTINDYSINQNKITYSLLSQPDYPTYVSDASKSISLCYYHDVKTCKTLDYTMLPPIVPSN
jgi:hypothetical protein